MNHETYMRRAIELGQKAAPYCFGAVIVDPETQRLLAEGWNRAHESPIWHGEIDVIHQCSQDHPEVDWEKLVLYTTAEPCPMCHSAILWAGIGTVVFGTSIRFLQSRGWNQIDIHSEELTRRTPFRDCVLIGGVLEPECYALFEGGPPS